MGIAVAAMPQTTEQRKAMLSSMVMQGIVDPMKLDLYRMQDQLAAAFEGRRYKAKSDAEIALTLAQEKIEQLTMELSSFMAALALSEQENNNGEMEDDG